jgi:tRNA-specific 2-thiouridylase
MSGGVDSSVAAALLLDQGYDVYGLTLRLWSEADDLSPSTADETDAIRDARLVAAKLGIPLQILDCAQRFQEQVVGYFIHEYARGHTPNPCLACNRHIKFGFLLETALAQGADYVATGHYARTRQAAHVYQLLRGRDQAKDQSYVLYMLGQDQLRHILLPDGDYTKKEIRRIAHTLDLPTHDRPESQDICFVCDLPPTGRDYRRFLRTYAPETIRPGPILDLEGHVLGEHQGLPFYTVGQRRGLGIAWSEPLYVIRVDAPQNALIVGPASALGSQHLLVTGVSYVASLPPAYPASVTVKIRYTGSEVHATLHPAPEDKVAIRLDVPLRDITPGQAAVFYQDEVVLGGGIIAEACSTSATCQGDDCLDVRA